MSTLSRSTCFFFFFNDTATTEIYTLSLHDALPIFEMAFHHHPDDARLARAKLVRDGRGDVGLLLVLLRDRKSTRLNSSHQIISYAVFCLKKKKTYVTGASPIVTTRYPTRTRTNTTS